MQSSDIDYVNYLLEYGFMRGFFFNLALYICSDNMSIAKSTEQALDIIGGKEDNIKRYIENDDNFTRDLMIRCKNPLSLMTSFQSSLFEKAQILEVIDSLDMIKRDVLQKYE